LRIFYNQFQLYRIAGQLGTNHKTLHLKGFTKAAVIHLDYNPDQERLGVS